MLEMVVVQLSLGGFCQGFSCKIYMGSSFMQKVNEKTSGDDQFSEKTSGSSKTKIRKTSFLPRAGPNVSDCAVPVDEQYQMSSASLSVPGGWWLALGTVWRCQQHQSRQPGRNHSLLAKLQALLAQVLPSRGWLFLS